MSIKLCVFDLDGTLLDTLTDLADSLNAALRDFSLPTYEQDQVAGFVGNGVQRLLSQAIPKGTSKALEFDVLYRFEAYYQEKKNDSTKPYPGISDLLETLYLSGIRLAVLSNKPHQAVDELIDDYFPGLFEIVQGQVEGLARKPSPEGLLKILEKMCIPANDSLYIGDTEVDVETAAAAGVSFIGCSWGFRSEKTLREAGAKRIIEEPQALLQGIFN